MALALILDVRAGPSGPVLRVDTGTNAFFRWRVGADRAEADGITELVGVSYESPVRRRVGTGAFQTTFDIALDVDRIDREHPLVQVVSSKAPDGRAPAWSAVRNVYGVGPGRGADGNAGGGMPDPLAGAGPMSGGWGPATATGPRLRPARPVAFSATEQPLSGALFWGELLSLVDDLAPLGRSILEVAADDDVQAGAAKLMELLGPVVKGLLEHAAAPVDAPPSSTDAPVARPTMGGTGPGAGRARPGGRARAAGPATTPAPRACTPGVASRHPGAAPGQAMPVASTMDFGTISGPALVGLITTLGPSVLKAITPLLEKAPEMLQTYLDHPVKLLTAIADANRQDQALTQQQVQRMLQSADHHLLLNLLGRLGRAPQPGIAALPATSAPLSVRARDRTAGARIRRGATSRRVDDRIELALVPPAPLPGQTTARGYYAAGRPIVLRLRLGTAQQPPDRPVPHVVAHVRVTEAAAGRTVLERQVELARVWLNEIVDVPLDAPTVRRLPAGADLNVSVDVTWTGREGTAYTTPTRAVQQVCLAGDHIVTGLGRRLGPELPLSDPARYRPFWHQIWEGGSPQHRRWELNATTRYYYRLAGDDPANGRMATRFKHVPDRSEESEQKVSWGGLLKSGMRLAVAALDELLPEVGLARWTPAELAAVGSATFAELTSRQATTELHLRGRTEERGSVWVFPVLQPFTVELHRVSAVAATGAVAATEARPKPFLLPVAAVFVGMESEG